MNISKNNLLFRWAYLDAFVFKNEKHPIPTRTTVCDIVGRAIFLTPVFVVLMLALLICLGIPLLLLVGIPEWISEKTGWGRRIKEKDRILAQRWKDWKERSCTIVSVRDGDNNADR